MLSGKLKDSGQGTTTGGKEGLEVLKVPTHTRVFVLIYLGKVPLVTNCKASPAVQPPPCRARICPSGNIKGFLRLQVSQTWFLSHRSVCKAPAAVSVHPAWCVFPSHKGPGRREREKKWMLATRKQVTESVSQRQQHPLLYLMYFSQHGVDSPLQTLESVSFPWIWELLPTVLGPRCQGPIPGSPSTWKSIYLGAPTGLAWETQGLGWVRGLRAEHGTKPASSVSLVALSYQS